MRLLVALTLLALVASVSWNYKLYQDAERTATQLRLIRYREVHNLEDEQDNHIPQPEGLQ